MTAQEHDIVARFRQGYGVKTIAVQENTTVEAIEEIIRKWMIAHRFDSWGRLPAHETLVLHSVTVEGLESIDGL